MHTLNESLENRNGQLFIDGVSTLTLAEKFDTPLYVISENRIKNNYQRLKTALTSKYDKVKIFYDYDFDVISGPSTPPRPPAPKPAPAPAKPMGK